MLPVYFLGVRLEPSHPAEQAQERFLKHGVPETEVAGVEIGEDTDEGAAQCENDCRHARTVPGIDAAVCQDDLGIRVGGDEFFGEAGAGQVGDGGAVAEQLVPVGAGEGGPWLKFLASSASFHMAQSSGL